MLDDSFSSAAEKHALESGASVRGHHDEVGGQIFRESRNSVKGRRSSEKVSGRRRELMFFREQVELACDVFLCFLIIGPRRIRNHRRHRRAESAWIIKLMHMSQMNSRVKARGKALRGVDRLDRHSRKIDWHENVSNGRCFHTRIVFGYGAIGSALIAKDAPFLAWAYFA